MMLFDKTETIGKSLVQYGPNNDRVYLMKLAPEDEGSILTEVYDLAILKRYSKIFAKVPASSCQLFLDNGYKEEARVPGFYGGEEDACFLGMYFSAKRSFLPPNTKKLIKSILEASEKPFFRSELQLPSGYSIKPLAEKHVRELAVLYKKVFEVYPFPIFEEKYLLETMRTNVAYFGVFKEDTLVATSSSEVDTKGLNAEMTDFATDPAHVGKKLSMFLLNEMENSMRSRGIQTVWTIARATSHGMNKTFGRMDYSFGGTLINNTLIGESIECMNVWYKKL